MNDKPVITAFNPIFEQKLHSLLKDIKKLRKDPEKKSRVKQCIAEARQLKKILKASKNDDVIVITLPPRIMANDITLSDNAVIESYLKFDDRTEIGIKRVK